MNQHAGGYVFIGAGMRGVLAKKGT